MSFVELNVPKNVDAKTHHNGDWKGFAKSVCELDKESAVNFCQTAIEAFLNSVTES